MAYLGNSPVLSQQEYRNIDNISGSFNGVTTSFPLRVNGVAPVPAPQSSNQCLISVNGVVQKPDDSGASGFRISGGNIIFSAAPTGGQSFFGVILAGADYIYAGENFPDGTVTAPSITFKQDLGTGFYRNGAGEVRFTSSGTNAAILNSSSLTAPSFIPTSSTAPTNGVYLPAANSVAISTGGSGRLFVDASGRVGVGTSSLPGWHSNYKVLHVGTQASATSYVGQSLLLAANAYDDGPGTWKYVGTNFATRYVQDPSNGSHSWAVASSGTAGGTVTWNTAMTIDSSSRVGIGSTSPDALLHIRGSGSPGIHITEVGGGSGSGNLYMNNNTYWLNADSAGSSLAFACGGGSEKARITAQGQLLVGTSSSRGAYAGNLEIEATSTAATIAVTRNSNDAFPAYLFLAKSRSASVGGNTIVASGDELGNLSFSGSDGVGPRIAASIKAEVDATPGANDMPGRLVFSTTVDGASSPTARMAILNTGELRLGSTNQTAISADACHTIGSVTLETVQTNLARLVIQERANNWISFKNGAGTHYGTISVSGAGVTYGSNSDYRLKENVFAIGQPVEKLKLLKPCQYSFIAIPGQRVDGFLAHELQEVVPSAVSGTKDATDANGNPEYQTVDASKLVPLLTAALQEAIGEIESLKARVTALESA